MRLPNDQLLDLVAENFGVAVAGVEDRENMSAAWQVVKALARQGWGVDVRVTSEIIHVDGYKFDPGPGTIFAQYGFRPSFGSTVEGICRTALIALFETGQLKE
jgi:hypothetical protein